MPLRSTPVFSSDEDDSDRETEKIKTEQPYDEEEKVLEAYCQQICDAVRTEMRKIRQAFQQIVTEVTHVQTDLMDKMYNQMCEVLRELCESRGRPCRRRQSVH